MKRFLGTKKAATAAAATLLVASLLVPLRSSAWDRAVVGTVARLEVYKDGSFAVQLDGSPALCSGPAANSWAATNGYVGTSLGMTPDGVKAFYASLLTAKISGKSVRLFAENDPTNPTTASCAILALDIMD